jgi:DNA-binding transcriptional ArsR family regulator
VVDATASPLLLAPSVLGAPHVTVQLDAAWPPGVQYPLVTGGQPVALAVVRRRLAALADPQRLRLCRSLLREARSTQELAALHGLTPPTVSRHLRRDAELVTTDRQGHFVRYRLDAAAVRSLGPDLLDALLR